METKIREPIGLNDSLMDVMVKMSEGNPGALSVLMGLLKHDKDFGFILILDLDDMNIRGPMIWLLYKNHFGQDIAKVADFCRARDAATIERLNQIARDNGVAPVAVKHGGSRR